MNFTKYPGRSWEDILAGASPRAIDFIRNLVVYESGDRFSAEQVRRSFLEAGPHVDILEALAHAFLQRNEE